MSDMISAANHRSAIRPDNDIEGFVGYILGWVWDLLDDATEGSIVIHAQLTCPALAFQPTFTVWEDSVPDLMTIHRCSVCHDTHTHPPEPQVLTRG